MLSNQEYIKISLEVNLFYQRIMKEHLFFLQTNLKPAASKYAAKADELKKQFEELLSQTLCCTSGLVPEDVIRSQELVTPYTLKAEEITSALTGAGIDTELTKEEAALSGGRSDYNGGGLFEAVNELNSQSASLAQETIAFQKELLSQSLSCQIFVSLYPLMLDHDTREAELYAQLLKGILSHQLPAAPLCPELDFWNTIMAEHVKFINGMLDPTETDLKQNALALAKEFETLAAECLDSAQTQILQKSLASAESIRVFKSTAAEGLLMCQIKSIIPPLLADHVLREASHYLRLLKERE